MIKRLSIDTKSRVEMRDITERVQEAVESSAVENGVCYVFVPHTTAAPHPQRTRGPRSD